MLLLFALTGNKMVHAKLVINHIHLVAQVFAKIKDVVNNMIVHAVFVDQLKNFMPFKEVFVYLSIVYSTIPQD